MKAKTTMKFFRVVFSIIGLSMLVGSFYFYQETSDFIRSAVKTQGVVVDLVSSRSSDSTTYAPTIRFKTEGGEMIEFTSSTSSNPPSYSRGEKVGVLYPTSQPNKARVDGFFSLWGGAAIMGILGGIFFLIGFGMTLLGILKSRKKEYLLSRGTRVNTNFQSVSKNTSLSVNGRNPFIIISQWMNPKTNELHIFKSENIWFNPEDHIKSDTVMVFIDPADPREYYVDISFLPKLA